MEGIFSHIAAAQGWRLVGGVAVDVYEGFPFVAKPKTSEVKKVIITFQMEYEMPSHLDKAMDDRLPKGCYGKVNVKTRRVQLICRRDSEDTVGYTIADCIAKAVKIFDMGNAWPAKTCRLCCKSGCDMLAVVDGAFAPVHSACVETATQHAAGEVFRNEDEGSYATGIIGAVLGGLVGSLPTVLTSGFLNLINVFLYSLIPIGAHIGYKLLKGKMDRLALYTTIAVSVLYMFGVQIVVLSMEIVRQLNIMPTVGETISIYWKAMAIPEVIRSFCLNAVFLALGIWIAWKRISRTNQGTAHDVVLMNESLTRLEVEAPD